jgi:pantoate--beta-alanine ligase
VEVIHTISAFRAWRAGVTGIVAFAPTMGALHEGHASLFRQARSLAGDRGAAVSSIFVNPTQFGPAEDFTKYPRTLDADVQILEAAGAAAVFVPSAQEMYDLAPGAPLNALSQTDAVTVDPGPLAATLEGAIRPGHFRGVCTVVLKLLNIVQPTHLLLGQKDFQQQAILRQMCRQLNLPVDVVTCPTIRESDGLALSSRNRYLSPDERARAIGLWDALSAAKRAFDAGQRNASALNAAMRQQLDLRQLDTQYALVAHAHTLAPCDATIDVPAVCLIAAKVGATRLIDNLLLTRE